MIDSWTSGTFECGTQREDGKCVCAGPKGGKAWISHTHTHMRACMHAHTHIHRNAHTLWSCSTLGCAPHESIDASCCLRRAVCSTAKEHTGLYIHVDGQVCVETRAGEIVSILCFVEYLSSFTSLHVCFFFLFYIFFIYFFICLFLLLFRPLLLLFSSFYSSPSSSPLLFLLLLHVPRE